ncbi:unnamed protein product [Boreogadus saida]
MMVKMSLAVFALLLASAALAQGQTEEGKEDPWFTSSLKQNSVCSKGVRREKVPSLGMSVGELLERANRGRTLRPNGPVVVEGDIAMKIVLGRNADPCTAQGCRWKKWTDGLVYIPYYIAANQYSPREKAIVIRGLESFSAVSCIRFRPTVQNDGDWLSIESESGCYSWVGRQGGKQVVSLARQGCLYHGTVQHELLHVLGFNHEQTRSDRDKYIRVAWENIIDDQKYNFNKLNTLNQGTPYDYSSVMQYERYAFSKNDQPTMIPIPNPNVPFGGSQEMSKNDIIRINNLYKCLEVPCPLLGSLAGHDIRGKRIVSFCD